MTINDLVSAYRKSDITTRIISGITANPTLKIQLKGTIGSSVSYIAAAVFAESQKNQLFIFSDKEESAEYLNDIEN